MTPAMIASFQELRLHKALRNFVAGFLEGYGLVSFLCLMFLQRHWEILAPKAPNVNLGLIYQNNEHGSYTYFSAFQATTCALMFMTSIPLAMLGIGIAPKKNLKYRVSKFSFGYTYDHDDPTSIQRKAFWFSAFLTPPFVFILGPHIIEMLNSIGVVINLG